MGFINPECGREKVLFFPPLFLYGQVRKDTLKEFEAAIKMAPGEGIEPPTRRLTAARSASLSYPGTWESYKAMFRECQGRGQGVFSPFFSTGLEGLVGLGYGIKGWGLESLGRM